MPDPAIASLMSWLRSNGAPALVPNSTKWEALASLTTAPLLLVGFMLRSLVQTVMRRSSSMLQVIPLLLVALTLSFFSAEVWQTIGRLHGLPLVLTALLFLALAAAFATRQARPDLDLLATFADADEVRTALPPRLRGGLADHPFQATASPPLSRRERVNLVVITVLVQVVTAAVIAMIIFIFFVVLGVLTADRGAIASWLGTAPRITASWHVAGHEYILTNELLRVSAFLGVFTGFYFIVSSSTDVAMRADLVAGHQRHVRTCLAVRHVYWDLVRD